VSTPPAHGHRQSFNEAGSSTVARLEENACRRTLLVVVVVVVVVGRRQRKEREVQQQRTKRPRHSTRSPGETLTTD